MLTGRKRTVFSLLLVVLFSLSIVSGCSSQPTDKQTSETSQPAQVPKVDAEQAVKDAAIKYYDKMSSNVYKISEDETKQLLDKGELKDYLVVDIRDEKSYNESHIPGAIFIPFKEVGKNLDLLATNAKGKKGVLVACVTGQTSGQTVATLNMVGISARSINLGMKLGWLAKKYPTETTVNKPLPVASYDWGDKAPVKQAVENYYEKMASSGMFSLYKISEEDLKAQLESNAEKFVVLDIRDKKDFDAATIKSAINIPFKEIGKNIDKIAELSKGKTVVVGCYTGQTAGQTDAVLNLIGIKTVSLNRGITAGWIGEKAYPVVKP
jgi:rhodanese-related sulfurtransferase